MCMEEESHGAWEANTYTCAASRRTWLASTCALAVVDRSLCSTMPETRGGRVEDARMGCGVWRPGACLYSPEGAGYASRLRAEATTTIG